MFVERTVVNRLDGQMRPGILWEAGRALFGRPELSILDLPNLVRGFRFSLDAMWAEVSKLNLLKLVPSVAFFDALAAPSKKLVWFDHSGHEAFVDEPEKFNATIVELVRPLTSSPVAESAPARLPVSA